MKIVLPLVVAFAAVIATPAVAAYPDHPVKVIVPFAAGGPADVTARLIFNKVGERLGQSFLIDNRGGAAGSLGDRHLVTGVDHAAYPTFDPAATVRSGTRSGGAGDRRPRPVAVGLHGELGLARRRDRTQDAAERLDRPGYPLRPGITFTYLGVKVDERARVQMAGGRAAENLFATGEIMAGNILGKGYLAGFGMAIGTVFGRIAGQEAAKHAGF